MHNGQLQIQRKSAIQTNKIKTEIVRKMLFFIDVLHANCGPTQKQLQQILLDIHFFSSRSPSVNEPLYRLFGQKLCEQCVFAVEFMQNLNELINDSPI